MKTAGRVVLAAVALLFVSSKASAFGVDLTWDDCVGGTNGTASVNKVFDCAVVSNRNYSLIFQFKSPVTVPNFVAATAQLDFGPVSASPLSPFWHFESGGCNAIGTSLLSAITPSCALGGYLTPWSGGVVTIACYSPDHQQPGYGRFILVVSRPNATEITAGDNYFGMELRFNNRNRSSCTGCNQQKLLSLEGIRLESNDGSPFVDLSGADKFTHCVAINNAPPSFCGKTIPQPTFSPPCGVTPAIQRTWGTLKMLYR